ncbi:ACT domain-containing protein ACR2 isoform X2 [Triticum aestivum]|uniref:ACT domain-containing protein ACR2 isoform X2 n=1 Tax=Triticum aestivum TaxID=4565 RepID=UPI001D02AE5B|nr:ACT domain-containing protein ACR2-like isoform X2 [Triticum aestivum]
MYNMGHHICYVLYGSKFMFQKVRHPCLKLILPRSANLHINTKGSLANEVNIHFNVSTSLPGLPYLIGYFICGEPQPKTLNECNFPCERSGRKQGLQQEGHKLYRAGIEMIGHNRPGIFSEISAVLAEQGCNVMEAHAWSHKDSLACVAFVSDESTSSPINDPNRLASIQDHLGTVLGPDTMDEDGRSARAHMLGADGLTSHPDRRLHQLMFSSKDFDGHPGKACTAFPMLSLDGYKKGRRTVVSVDRCNEKGYSVVNVECVDRPKLMFDTVCTLTDMQFNVFHASVSSRGPFACQEYYIRHRDGHILDTADERCLVVKGVKAAVERRTCEGVKLELCTENNAGLLSYITRVLRENGLTVRQADIAMEGNKMKNTFYVQGISDNKIDMDVVESVRRELDPLPFQVKDDALLSPGQLEGEPAAERNVFCILGLLRSKIESLSWFHLLRDDTSFWYLKSWNINSDQWEDMR